MKRQTLRRRHLRRGGKALATGSDGCVFDGTFAPDGTFTKSTTMVTKVFPPETAGVATNEYERMQEVKDATGGIGVLVTSDPLVTIAAIPGTAWEGEAIKTRHACKKVFESTAGPFVGLTLPLINGDFNGLKRDQRIPIPGDALADLSGALVTMKLARLVHMDFAARNIFYTETGGSLNALLGDFGATISLRSNFEANIRAYLTRYGLRGKILAFTKVDGLTPTALAQMILYDSLLEGKVAFEAVLKQIQDGKYIDRSLELAYETWAGSRVLDSSSGNSESDRFAELLGEDIERILTLYAGPDKTYEGVLAGKSALSNRLKYELSISDQRLFVILGNLYGASVLSEEQCKTINEFWYPTRRGGGQSAADSRSPLDFIVTSQSSQPSAPRRSALPTTDFDTPEEAFAQPDPVLSSVGARRRTRRKRARRVKMSRRN